ncbi:SseB family protein [Micromonospora sp. NPDC050695]|uniref:SseB family protein n=2 Tax=unclassified Micromonospora TaxID=2617518 RepID=UPI00340BC5AF
MTEWEPATEAEVAMRDALRANDQELYFRLLSRTDLLLPVSAPALAGQASPGWGTWTTGGRTHVLAFTSAAALRTCLGDHPGSNRRVPFTDLAVGWPNHEWWLAVNPGLPVEGYLPAWFVSQLSRGDVRLPGRAMGARARLERAETLARTRTGAPGRDAAGSTPTAGPMPSGPMPSGPDPVAIPPVRPAPTRPAVPRMTSPLGPGTSRSTPGAGDLSRLSGGEDLPAAGQRHPSAAPGPDSVPAAGARPAAPRFAPSTAADRPGAVPTDQSGTATGRPPTARPGDAAAPANGTAQGDRRSFFEPASGRGRATGPTPGAGRPGERAAPPSRFGRGSQPFPRRRPADAPSADGATRAFPMTDASVPRPPRPAAGDPLAFRGVRSPAPGDEPTQPLPPRRPDRLAEEPTRAFRAAGAPPPTRPAPSAEETQAIPRGRPGEPGRYEPVEELSPSIAEPVSGPPAPRRGFTPIVIEGTIIESRDLTDPSGTAQAGGGWLAAGSLRADDLLGGRTAFDPVVDPVSPPPPAPDSAAEPPRPDPVAPPPRPDSGPEPVRPDTDDRYAATGGEEQRAPAEPAPLDFDPANTVEEDLLNAAGAGSTDTFLSTLLLARVLLPAAPDSVRGSRPGDPGFVWRTAQLDGDTYVVVYTSPERLADHTDGDVDTVRVKFAQLIRRWPDEDWSFAVNPGTPVGAKLPGEQIVALANWAAEVGLGDDLEVDPEEAPVVAEPAARPRYAPAAVDPARPTVMQKAIAPSQLAYYLERGYDRVSGFVHRAGELAHLTTPAQLYDALGLSYPASPFVRDAEEIYVLRWPAHRPSLYRIPYGGQNEPAMRAMEGWVIERPPFRGNGFAPGESSDVVAEFKVDSARLPHGAQLWRIAADGTERVVASLDTDAVVWRRVGEA